MTEDSTRLGRLLLEEYLTSLAAAHYARSTVDARKRCLASISRHVPLEQMTPGAFATLAQVRGWSPGTLFAYGQIIGLFTRWAHREGHIPVDPFADARRPRQPKYPPRPATRDELAIIEERVAEPMRSWAQLAAYAGLRRMEIAQLRGVDLVPTLTGHDLHIPRGKGGKAAVVPAHDKVVAILEHAPRGTVFTTRTGRPYTLGHMGEMASTAFRGAGVDVTLHRLRHTFGTELYRATHDVFLVQRALRHDSIRSTQIYVEADTSWIREAVAAL